MVQTTLWFEYGEPTDNGRVEAYIRTAYQTGPNETPREDDVVKGTVGFEALQMMGENSEVQRHTHDDESVMLSGLSAETEERFLDTFEEYDED